MGGSRSRKSSILSSIQQAPPFSKLRTSPVEEEWTSFILPSFSLQQKKKNHLATKRVRSRRCSSKRWRRDNFSRYRSFLSIAISADKLLSNDERSDNDFRRASSLSLVSNRDECAQPNRFLTPLKLEWNACVFPWTLSAVRFSKDVTQFRIESNEQVSTCIHVVASVAREVAHDVVCTREKVKGTIDIHCAR